MKSVIKTFVIGVLIGGIIAFHLGMNYGRGRALLSNPYEGLDVSRAVKEKARGAVESGREKIHEITAPEKK